MIRLLRWAAGILIGVSAAIVLAALVTWPADLAWMPSAPDVGDDPVAWLAAQEAEVSSGIVPGTEKRILWQDAETRERTPLAVVYLHGFSASRQEIAPVPKRLAAELDANLFETRLAGHGLERDRLANVSAEDWMRDVDEALAIGRRLGERVLLIGTSSGATLALARLAAGDAPEVAALVLLSPNLGPAEPSADLLVGPGGPLLGRLLVGENRSFEPANAAHARYWTTTYPTAAVVQVMRVVTAVRASLPLTLDVPLLVLVSEEDRVIDVERALEALSAIEAPVRRILSVESAGPGRHIPAGDILSPEQTSITVTRIRAFVEDHVQGGAPGGGL